MFEQRQPLAPPSLLKAMMETRAIPECLLGWYSLPWVRYLPHGDGHPVLVLPGFMLDKSSTFHLRWTISSLGYRVFDWRLGRNTGPVGHFEDDVLKRIETIRSRTGEKPSLVGWSLGGVYARVLAHRAPDQIRSIITLGSPVRFPHRSTADGLYRKVSGQFDHPEYLQQVAAAPSVPTTAVYSRLDGIVNWQACLGEESELAENVGVLGSHCGLGYNPTVFRIVANRLAQPENQWVRFSWADVDWRPKWQYRATDAVVS